MKKTLLFIVAITLIFNCGCLHRRLTIKSDPAGATVFYNQKEIGATPIEFDFLWYHDNHLVKLEKEGYETLEASESIEPPWYLWIPLDLIAEIMPVDVEDFYEFSYTLDPKPAKKPVSEYKEKAPEETEPEAKPAETPTPKTAEKPGKKINELIPEEIIPE